MSSSRPPRSPRAARSPELIDRLERSRERVRKRRERARERERVVAGAVRRYLDAWQAIRLREAERNAAIDGLRRQISDIESRAVEDIAGLRGDQAVAAVAIREQGQTDDDIADLLEISVKQVRQLISLARSQAPTQSTAKPQLSVGVTGSETTIRNLGLRETTTSDDVED
jgi:DNA-directed RNA polymerase specialized sigma24 family protein